MGCMALVDIGNRPQVNLSLSRVSARARRPTRDNSHVLKKAIFFDGPDSFSSILNAVIRPREVFERRRAMTAQDTTRKVVEAYFAAWTSKNVDEHDAPLA